jgi:F-type H+-transporting ATPase subunit delta
MNDSQISVRYARALFLSASEKQVSDRVYKDMELLAETCRLEDFQYLLMVPSLKPGKKCDLLESILKDNVCDLTMSMIKLVIQNKREVYLPGIARNYRDLYRKAMGIRSASLVTAHPVDDHILDGVKKLITRTYKSDVELTSKVNDDLIGGFVLTIEGQQYDASVARSLKKMKKQLLQTNFEKR